MKKDKELARECFDHYLEESLHLHARWSAGEKPPDYYLEVGSHRLAVQVGVLDGWPATDGPRWFHQEWGPSGDTYTDQAVVENIQTAAVDRAMRGSYWISFGESFPDFKGVYQEQLAEEALQYIEDTQRSPAPPRHSICARGVEVCRIGKWPTKADSFQLVELPLLSYIVDRGQRVPEAFKVLKEAVSTAQRQLSQLPLGRLRMPTLLLLLDRWPHGGDSIYKACMGVLELPDRPDWIFVVEDSKKGYFPLEEHERWWMGVAGISQPPRCRSAGSAGSTPV